jgi:threonine/homoserine/homoserine lactone efflux protein
MQEDPGYGWGDFLFLLSNVVWVLLWTPAAALIASLAPRVRRYFASRGATERTSGCLVWLLGGAVVLAYLPIFVILFFSWFALLDWILGWFGEST